MKTKIRFTEYDIKAVMNSYPDICPHGFVAAEDELLNGRAAMQSADFVVEVNDAAEYIDSYPDPVRKIGSYGLKHRAEKWRSTYISNGAFIVAAILLGYRLKRYPKSPNCTFAKKT